MLDRSELNDMTGYAGVLLPIIAVMILAFGLLVAIDSRRSARANHVLLGSHVAGCTPEVVLQQVILEVASINKRSATNVAPGTVVVETRFIPGWTLFPIVLLFPLGLLFLAVKDVHNTTVVATPFPGGSVIQVNGWLDDKLRSHLLGLFDRLGATPSEASSTPPHSLGASLVLPPPPVSPPLPLPSDREAGAS